jgi:hypothetical protein
MDVMCSGCHATGDAANFHRIPVWNPRFGTVWSCARCDDCLEEAFAATLAAVENIDADVQAAFAEFMADHQLAPHDALMQKGDPQDWQPLLREFLLGLREECRRAAEERRQQGGDGEAPATGDRDSAERRDAT